MPNWVSNNLIVTGPAEELDRFEEFAKGKSPYESDEQDLCFHKFIPYPQEFLYMDKESRELAEQLAKLPDEERRAAERIAGDSLLDGYNRGGHDWCTNNWGVKWDADHVEFSREPASCLSYDFETAWSVPEPVIYAMSAAFPTLTFDLKYEEETGWGGELTLMDGDELHSMNWDAEENPNREPDEDDSEDEFEEEPAKEVVK